MLHHLVIAVWAPRVSKKATIIYCLGLPGTAAPTNGNGRSVLRKRDNGRCTNTKLILNKHVFVVDEY